MTPDSSLLTAHDERTRRVALAVQSFYERKAAFRIFHGGTSSTRRRKHDPSKVIDTSAFTNVLLIDHGRKVAVVEPNVSMEQLVDATLPLGLVPLVVMEFPGITVNSKVKSP